jgi:hypothetical protein
MRERNAQGRGMRGEECTRERNERRGMSEGEGGRERGLEREGEE